MSAADDNPNSNEKTAKMTLIRIRDWIKVGANLKINSFFRKSIIYIISLTIDLDLD